MNKEAEKNIAIVDVNEWYNLKKANEEHEEEFESFKAKIEAGGSVYIYDTPYRDFSRSKYYHPWKMPIMRWLNTGQINDELVKKNKELAEKIIKLEEHIERLSDKEENYTAKKTRRWGWWL